MHTANEILPCPRDGTISYLYIASICITANEIDRCGVLDCVIESVLCEKINWSVEYKSGWINFFSLNVCIQGFM